MRQRWLTVFLIAIEGALLASPVHTIDSEQAAAQSEIHVVRAVPAHYPPIATLARESGTVVVEVKIKSSKSSKKRKPGAEPGSVFAAVMCRTTGERRAYSHTMPGNA
jgi:hypothetical protein